MPLLFPPQMTFWRAFQAGLVEPKRSPGYISWLHTRRCAIDNTSIAIQAHHLVGHGLKPAGGKTCDFLAIPLEHTVHGPGYPGSLHDLGHKEWERVHISQLELALRTLMEAIHEGKLVFKP